jgi:DNA-directed RNA polymerase specialized sigma24 family protein
MSRTAQDIIEIGRDLIAVKERLMRPNRHDTEREGFHNWIDREFGMSRRTAQTFMSVFARYGDTGATIAHLPPTVIYELSAESTPAEVREEIAERAAAGETITAAELERLPINQRNALTAHIYGRSYDDVAKELSIPLGTVKSRINRARRNIVAMRVEMMEGAND